MSHLHFQRAHAPGSVLRPSEVAEDAVGVQERMSADTQLESILNSVGSLSSSVACGPFMFRNGNKFSRRAGRRVLRAETRRSLWLTLRLRAASDQVLKEVCMRGDFIHAEALK